MLRCERVSKSFGGNHVLRDFSWEFLPGLTAVVGLNGSGKSTLLNVLSGFAAADSGRIWWRGAPISGLHPTQVARRGLVRTFQNDLAASSLAVREHVALGVVGEPRRTALGALLDPAKRRHSAEVGVARTVRRAIAAIGIEALAERPVQALSVGQRRLVTLATCLATDAAGFLFDEPFAGVDSDHAAHIARTIRQLSEAGKVVVLVAHERRYLVELPLVAVELRDGAARPTTLESALE